MAFSFSACKEPAVEDDLTTTPDGQTPQDIGPVAVTGVTLSDSNITIVIGEERTLTANVQPSDAANKDVSWTSSDNTKASVDAAGKVTGIALGDATITVTTADGGHTATCAVTVKRVPVSIAVTTQPTKTTYALNEPLDLTGLVVTATYDDSSTEVIPITLSQTSGFNSSSTGTKTVTITYGGQTATFTVTVVTIDDILLTPPTKTEYRIGDELNLAGLQVIAVYSNGSQSPIDINALTISGFSSATAGEKTITVSYGGKSKTFTITVLNVTLESIAITEQPTKTSYYFFEELDLAGLIVTATYSDEYTEPVMITASNISNFVNNVAGDKYLQVTYGGKTAPTFITITIVAATFTVNFNSNGGTTDASPITKTVTQPADTIDALPTVPARSGYVFNGWNTQADGNGTAFTAEYPINLSTTVSLELTVYAQWRLPTVTFDKNGGATEASPRVMQVTTANTAFGTLPTEPNPQPHYSFVSWNTNADGSGTVFNSSTVVTADMTVYAIWQGNTYTVTFDATEGSVSPATIAITRPNTKVSDVTTLPIPTRSGYTSTGWYTAENGFGSVFDGNTTVNADITVYANWVQDKIVTFNGNGGKWGEATTITAEVKYPNTTLGSSMPESPTAAGKGFAGWYSNEEGTGVQFTSSTTVTENITVYAKWELPKASFNPNGGNWSGSTAVIVKEATSPESGLGVANMPANPSRDHYQFVEWNTANDGSGTAFGATTPVMNNITIFAKWDGNTYTVTFNGDGGTPASDSRSVKYPTSTLAGNMPTVTREHWSFTGWTIDGSGEAFTESTVITGDITVTAQWVPATYTVTFNGNGGTPASQTRDVTRPTTTVGTLPTVTRDHYTFVKWTTGQDGTGTEFTASTVVNASQTVYAQWTPNTYTVTFNGNNGTPVTQTINVTRPATTVGTLPVVTREHYTFDKWTTGEDGSGTTFAANTVVVASIEVYAQWIPNTYTVTFNGNGGTLTTQTINVTRPATTVGTLPVVTREHYDFVKWTANQDGTGTEFTASTVVNASITVYAQWREIFTVTFVPNGGNWNGSTANLEIKVNSGDTVARPVDPIGVLKQGLYKTIAHITPTLDNWDYNGTAWNFNTPVTGNMILTAKWGPNPINLTGVTGNNIISQAITYMNAAGNTGEYTLLLNENLTNITTAFTISGTDNLLLLRGIVPVEISLASNATTISLFVISSGASLSLSDNITLKGTTGSNRSLISVSGNLHMFAGTITGHITSNNGAGVYVGGSGTFNMYGGIISGNTSTDTSNGGGGVQVFGTFNMSGGTITGNTAPKGGGVGVSSSTSGSGNQIFNMTGGIISGNTAQGTNPFGGGVCINRNAPVTSNVGKFTKTGGTIYGNDGTANANRALYTTGEVYNQRGHAAYTGINTSARYYRDTTAGTGVNLDSGNVTNWNQ